MHTLAGSPQRTSGDGLGEPRANTSLRLSGHGSWGAEGLVLRWHFAKGSPRGPGGGTERGPTSGSSAFSLPTWHVPHPSGGEKLRPTGPTLHSLGRLLLVHHGTAQCLVPWSPVLKKVFPEGSKGVVTNFGNADWDVGTLTHALPHVSKRSNIQWSEKKKFSVSKLQGSCSKVLSVLCDYPVRAGSHCDCPVLDPL